MSNRSPDSARNPWTLLIAAATAIAAVVVSGVVARSPESPAWLRLAAGLLPVPFTIAFIWAELRWIQRTDEFHRRVILDSLAIAFPASLLVAIGVEGLQKAGYVREWTVGDVWPWMAIVWVPCIWWAHRRYR